jgi:hypothetical protein
MQSKIRLIAIVSVVMAISIVSCKKDTASSTNTDAVTELTAQTDDQSSVSASSDAVENDINVAIEDNSAFNGRIANTLGNVCNATVAADSSNGVRRITITYNGANCTGNRSLTGVVVLSMPIGTHFKDAGAVLSVSTQNLKVTRIRDNKSIVINGSKTITNVSGGRLRDLATIHTVTHTISGQDSITFDNGKQRIWQVAKQRVFTYDNGIVITTTGTHSEGGVSGIAEWGTNRFGNAFVTAISQPVVIRQDCDFRVVSGVIVHSKLIADVTVTFGLDAAGAPTSCPGTGTYYYKAVWVGVNGVTKTVILPY